MSIEIETKNERETKKVGEILAKEILENKLGEEAVVICLEGIFGAGKTTFLKGFARGLKIKEKILSQSFILLKKFKIPKSKFRYFFAFDCYRIEKEKEILNLAFKEIVRDPRNIVAIEWAGKIKKIVPKNAIWLFFKIKSEKERIIKVKM